MCRQARRVAELCDKLAIPVGVAQQLVGSSSCSSTSPRHPHVFALEEELLLEDPDVRPYLWDLE